MQDSCAMTKNELITERELTRLDENFIYATWLKGLRYGNDLFELIDSEAYFSNYRKIIQFFLSTSQVKIACLKETPETILGYSVSDGSRLHWLHVKEEWRRLGIAKSLLPPDFKAYSHLSKLGFEILQTHPGPIFNPFIHPERTL